MSKFEETYNKIILINTGLLFGIVSVLVCLFHFVILHKQYKAPAVIHRTALSSKLWKSEAKNNLMLLFFTMNYFKRIHKNSLKATFNHSLLFASLTTIVIVLDQLILFPTLLKILLIWGYLASLFMQHMKLPYSITIRKYPQRTQKMNPIHYNKVPDNYNYCTTLDFYIPFFSKESEAFNDTMAQNIQINSGTTLLPMLMSGFNVLSETSYCIGIIRHVYDHGRVRLEKFFPLREHFLQEVPYHYIWDG